MTKQEAIKVAGEMYGWLKTDREREALETLIPELSESNDERIRKYLIEELKAAKSVWELKFIIPQPTREECIAYLEKQTAIQAHIRLEDGEGLSFLNIFKAGAEWMAGQFQKIDGDLVDWYSTSDGKDYCCGVKTQDAFEVPEGFYIKKK